MVADCDSVLLKPFAPNLIYSRLSRMINAAADASASIRTPQGTREPQLSEIGPFAQRGDLLSAGYLRDWPTTQCAYCDHEGVTGFEYASHRRAWYACLACKKVWMAKRRD
jgi:hypothetical protein